MGEHDWMNWKRGQGLLIARGQPPSREEGRIRGGVWFPAVGRDDREPTAAELAGGAGVRLWPGDAVEFRRFYNADRCAICYHVALGLFAASVASLTRRE